MLFDLRGRGRRRTVQVVYLGLALLMGGGLVLLGVGGGTNGGGLLDAFTNGNGSSDTGVFADQRKAAEKRVAADRTSAPLWAALAKAQYQEASANGGLDSATGAFNAKGKARLQQASYAWEKYLALNPETPDPNTAVIMVQVYSPGALDKPDDAVAAQEVVADSRNDVGSYLQLTQYAYLANQTRKAELAGAKAESLATKDQKEQIKAQVASLKSAADQAAVQAAQSNTSGATTSVPATGTTP